MILETWDDVVMQIGRLVTIVCDEEGYEDPHGAIWDLLDEFDHGDLRAIIQVFSSIIAGFAVVMAAEGRTTRDEVIAQFVESSLNQISEP